MYPMLLDRCQTVLIYPVKVIPCLAYTSSLPPTFFTGIYLEQTPEYQILYITGIECFTTYSWNWP